MRMDSERWSWWLSTQRAWAGYERNRQFVPGLGSRIYWHYADAVAYAIGEVEEPR